MPTITAGFFAALKRTAVSCAASAVLRSSERGNSSAPLHSRVVEDARGAGELVVDAELRVDLLGLMMDQLPELALLLARPAAHDEDRHPLRERAGDGIHHVVAAGAVGDADDPDAAGRARVAVGGEADPRLVRERHDA